MFTESIEPYKELRNIVFTDNLFERQFKIGFSNEDIKNAYEKLLENRCKLCEKQPVFRTFSMLSDHTRKIHERFFCDLCVKHLRVRLFLFGTWFLVLLLNLFLLDWLRDINNFEVGVLILPQGDGRHSNACLI